MQTGRRALHHLVDTLPADRIAIAEAVLLLIADAEGVRLSPEAVRRALGQPGAPTDGEDDLDRDLAADPGLRTQLEASLQELRSGRPLVDHETVERIVRDDRNG